jgi:hypothetical protein
MKPLKPSKRRPSNPIVSTSQAVSGASDHKTIDSGAVQNQPIRLSRLSKEEVENRRCKAYKYFI